MSLAASFLIAGAVASAEPVASQAMVPTNVPNAGSLANDDVIIEKFIAACMEGQVSFAKQSIIEIPLARLPSRLQQRYDDLSTARLYKITGSRTVYMIMYDRPDAKKNKYKYVCAVATHYLPVVDTFSKIQDYLNIRKGGFNKRAVEVGYTAPDFEYQVSVTKIGPQIRDFVVMQLSRPNDEFRAGMRMRMAKKQAEVK